MVASGSLKQEVWEHVQLFRKNMECTICIMMPYYKNRLAVERCKVNQKQNFKWFKNQTLISSKANKLKLFHQKSF